ncbi:RNA polymerase sigma factor [Virgisporangium ochraceum]|uniref:Siderophore-interacting protein n=1 Tax=Virgisporangium ochraceum TaxID=65505 RepID=A0A8J3ZZI0_9ACTN|nr:RNA polymerase sigma factor [Virgisporangium ochraceum]GIJ72138.1 siderophore-interacting protein [Virgisporangium ochraceum]
MGKSLRVRVRAGDPEAFRELFVDHARPVYNHAFRLTGTWSTAEDVVSLTFLEAWRLRDRIDDGDGSLRPWLLGIATNVARNVRRAARRHDGALARLPRPQPVPDLAEEVGSRVDDRERLARVTVALAALRASEREVLALCVWAGLDHAEAAAALGVRVGTVRSRLSRARARLTRLVATGKLPPPGEGREPPAATGQTKGGRDRAALLAEEEVR